MDVPVFVVQKEDVKQRPSDRQDQNAQPRGATSPAHGTLEVSMKKLDFTMSGWWFQPLWKILPSRKLT